MTTHGTNYPRTPTGTVDLLGDEFPSPFMTRQSTALSPLAADIPGADTTNWTDEPRPSVTAWEGADYDAYYFDDASGMWRHCRTRAAWIAPITLEQATGAFCAALMAPYRIAAE